MMQTIHEEIRCWIQTNANMKDAVFQAKLFPNLPPVRSDASAVADERKGNTGKGDEFDSSAHCKEYLEYIYDSESGRHYSVELFVNGQSGSHDDYEG